MPKTTRFAVDFEDQVKAAVQQELAVEQVSADQANIRVNELIVEQVQIENSTIHIGEVTVVQPTASETERHGESEEPSIEHTPKQEKSRIPFNVLMLKSDKEKWQYRQQKQLVKQSIKEDIQPVNMSAILPEITVEPTEIIGEDPEPIQVTTPPLQIPLSQPIASPIMQRKLYLLLRWHL